MQLPVLYGTYAVWELCRSVLWYVYINLLQLKYKKPQKTVSFGEYVEVICLTSQDAKRVFRYESWPMKPKKRAEDKEVSMLIAYNFEDLPVLSRKAKYEDYKGKLAGGAAYEEEADKTPIKEATSPTLSSSPISASSYESPGDRAIVPYTGESPSPTTPAMAIVPYSYESPPRKRLKYKQGLIFNYATPTKKTEELQIVMKEESIAVHEDEEKKAVQQEKLLSFKAFGQKGGIKSAERRREIARAKKAYQDSLEKDTSIKKDKEKSYMLFSPKEKVAMALHMKAERKNYKADILGERAFWTNMCMHYFPRYSRKNVIRLKSIYSNLEKNMKEVKDREPKNQYHQKRYDRNRGLRKSGGGRKSHIQHLKNQMKQDCIDEEVHHGHDLIDSDIMVMWKSLLSKRLLELLRLERDTKILDIAKLKEKQAIEHKLELLDSKKKYWNQQTDLLHYLGRSTNCGHKRDMLSEREEEIRAMLSWQDFDYMLFLLTVSEDEELIGRYVVDVQGWKDKAQDLVLEFEDEIPLWIGYS